MGVDLHLWNVITYCDVDLAYRTDKFSRQKAGGVEVTAELSGANVAVNMGDVKADRMDMTEGVNMGGIVAGVFTMGSVRWVATLGQGCIVRSYRNQ